MNATRTTRTQRPAGSPAYYLGREAATWLSPRQYRRRPASR
jgi:hypothetical protein